MKLQSHEALSVLTHLFQKWEIEVQRCKVTAEGAAGTGLQDSCPWDGACRG